MREESIVAEFLDGYLRLSQRDYEAAETMNGSTLVESENSELSLNLE